MTHEGRCDGGARKDCGIILVDDAAEGVDAVGHDLQVGCVQSPGLRVGEMLPPYTGYFLN